MQKINLSDEKQTRTRVLSGVRKMAELVGMTLGPMGRSVLIERGTASEPLLVDDGRRVAENIKLDDPIEQLAVRTLYSVTRKTDEKVGDGTTTATVLSHAIMDELSKNHVMSGGMISSVDVAELDRKINSAREEIVGHLRSIAKPVKTEKELIDVASVVAGDENIGEIIGKMYFQLGKDGHITLEFNLLSEQIESEVVPGYRFSGGYAAEWMMTDSMRRTASMTDVHVLVTSHKDLDTNKVTPILQLLMGNNKRRLVIIAPKFTPSFLKDVYATALKGGFPILCVRAPSRGEEAFKDIAVFTGGKYFSENEELGSDVQNSDLGYVERIDVTDDTTILVNGGGKKEDVAARIKEVQAEADAQKLPQFKADRLERVSALSSGVGVIRIGAPTDEERNWLKYKIEDAKYATKHAFREGIVPGGGLAFKTISEKFLPDTNILKNAILAPYHTLKKNAGGELKVGKNVFDPVAVPMAALEHACSAASKLIRIGGAIAFAPRPKLDEAMRSAVGNGNGVQEDEDEDYG